jgi:hypothetical protein
LSIVTTSVATARQSSGGPGISGFAAELGVEPPPWSGTVGPMVGTALRPISHLAAWLVWHAARVSLLEDLERPSPPHAA